MLFRICNPEAASRGFVIRITHQKKRYDFHPKKSFLNFLFAAGKQKKCAWEQTHFHFYENSMVITLKTAKVYGPD